MTEGNMPNLDSPLTRPGARAVLPHVSTFASYNLSPARTHRWAFDEALRHNPENARAARRDPFIVALHKARTITVANRPFSIEVDNPDDPIQKAAADRVAKIIQRIPRFVRIKNSLMEANWFGRSAVQLFWDYRSISGETAFLPVDSHPVNGDKVVFKFDGTPGIVLSRAFLSNTIASKDYSQLKAETIDRGQAFFLYDRHWREQFIIHKFDPEDADYYESELSGGIHGVGSRSRVYWTWHLRQEALSWLLSYLERVGAGGIVKVYFESGNDDSVKAADSIAEQLLVSNIVKIPRITGRPDANEVVIEPPSESGVNILIDIINRFDNHIAAVMLGVSPLYVNLTSTGRGGEGWSDDFAEAVTETLKYDAQMLDETLTVDLVAPIVRHNFRGEIPFGIRYKSDISSLNQEKVLKAIKYAYDTGVKIRADQIRAAAGCTTPREGDETVQNPSYRQLDSLIESSIGSVMPEDFQKKFKGDLSLQDEVDGKQVHQMSKEEYIKSQIEAYPRLSGHPPEEGLMRQLVKLASEKHKRAVQDAIRSGKSNEVSEILKNDYPDMVREYKLDAMDDQVVISK